MDGSTLWNRRAPSKTTTRIRATGTDPIHWLIPGTGWSVDQVLPYMLRIVDVAGAVAARGWPAGLRAKVTLYVDDPICPWNSGRYRLVLDSGRGRVEPAAAGEDATVVTPGGLAVLYAGGVSVDALRRTGLISGGSAAGDSTLDAAFAGPRPGILDYF